MEAAKLNRELLEQYILAGSPNARLEQLRVLAEHHCDAIRARVAENPLSPPELLWNLAHDSSRDVRIAAGSNPSADESILNRLVRDSDIAIRHGLAQSITTPRPFLLILAEDDNGWVRGEAIKSIEIIDRSAGDEMAKRRNSRKVRRNKSQTSTVHFESTEEVAS